MRTVLVWLAGAGLALAGGGCQTAPVTAGGTRNPKPVSSVVSLSPSTTEIVASLNYSGVLKGRTAADDFPKTIEKVEVVASVKPDYEKIAAIKPDLVVYDPTLYNEGDVEKIKALGGEMFPFASKTIDEFLDEIYRLGVKLSSETNASSYVDKVQDAREAALGDAPSPKPKVAVVLVGTGAEHYVAGTDSFIADVVRGSGGEPVGPGGDRFVPLAPEAFLASAPTMIAVAVTKENAAATVARLLADPRLKTVPAIQNRKILPVDEDVLTRKGFRVDKLIEAFRGGFKR